MPRRVARRIAPAIRLRKKKGTAMRVAWAIGTTMLVVCGSTMHATQASSEAIHEEYPTSGAVVKGTDVPAPPGALSTAKLRNERMRAGNLPPEKRASR